MSNITHNSFPIVLCKRICDARLPLTALNTHSSFQFLLPLLRMKKKLYTSSLGDLSEILYEVYAAKREWSFNDA